MALELNVDAQEFVPSSSSTKKKKTTSEPPASNNNQQSSFNQCGNPQQIQLLPFNPNTVQSYNSNLNQINQTYFQNQSHFRSMNPSQNGGFIQQKQHNTQMALDQQQTTIKDLTNLFPSIDSSKLQQILQSNAYNLKLSILHILKSTEFKGSYDQNICVYNLSNSCQHKDNPSKCRYKHDNNVPSAICLYWLSNTCIKGEQCPFLHRIPIKTIPTDTSSNQQQQTQQPDVEELILMLSAMFPEEKPTRFKKLLGTFLKIMSHSVTEYIQRTRT